ncbi:MAG: bifunctional proline dehydrogenase/L-glutamate gamma-semialdehyde dehydrogenase PutA [Pseudomonadota bacterium]
MEHQKLEKLYWDEEKAVQELLNNITWSDKEAKSISNDAAQAIKGIRKTRRKSGSLESFFQQYGLNTEEGLALMSMAEALLRIPDNKTANALIRDKISGTNWLRGSEEKDWMTRVAGLGLSASTKTMNSLFSKLGEPVIREAMIKAMKVLGKQFVVGEDIRTAMKSAIDWQEKGFRFSYDMLGEGARTFEDAARYFDNYKSALEILADNKTNEQQFISKDNPPGISVKLTALHPRFEWVHKDEVVPDMVKKLKTLCDIAAKNNLTLTIDAEEIARIDLTIEILERLLEQVFSKSWKGLGLAIQAYHKAAPDLIDHIIELAEIHERKIQIRLVKGAYWDSEIKHAQLMGHETYPTYTRKVSTDVSYLYCAQKMMARRDVLYPMFGTHNAHTVFSILKMAGGTKKTNHKDFEFQKLYGMGDALYNYLVNNNYKIKICVYAPVGPFNDLLPYLVRRMLENGANSSFVHKIYDKTYKPEQIATDPIEQLKNTESFAHPKIPLPIDLFGRTRQNSKGLNFDNPLVLEELEANLAQYSGTIYKAVSIVNGKEERNGTKTSIESPTTKERIGQAIFASYETIEQAAETAHTGHQIWSETSAQHRAQILEKIATLLDHNREELIYLTNTEGGRTLKDCDDEVREAIDFCRYYAAMGRQDFNEVGKSLISPTGETNIYQLKSRGIFVCISPWNFPIAIFTGQIVAALMAGNAVIAKPAEQTLITAYKVVKLMLEAGVPPQTLNLILGDGKVGAALIEVKNLAGVAFTGSTHVAQIINQTLSQKSGAIPRLIAETGGQNAMIVDSSALTEQVVDDVIHSAFGSAGQRCSACRILYLQDDIADKTIEMLKGAMQAIKVGDPSYVSTDIGPLINEEARAIVQHHKVRLEGSGKKIAKVPIDKNLENQGTFFAPIAYEIPDINYLEKEIFGPVLHIIRFKANDIDKVIDEINATGFGLTFGIHSRIDSFIKKVTSRVKAGNVYVNKSTIGAVVGVQPFGGRGMSGTGPKAGGPQYLRAFATEKLISTDTTAAGGNTSLVMLDD